MQLDRAVSFEPERIAKSRLRIVVVGNGMVGHRFCETLVERDSATTVRVVVFGEEPRVAYDRVHLSGYFDGQSAEDLSLGSRQWYADHGIELHLGDPIVEIDRENRFVVSAAGKRVDYDALVMATGSAPFVPPIAGIELPGVFVYRTIEDLEAIESWAADKNTSRAAVIGGGLLGLEAAKATVDLGLESHVIEHGDRLMPRQVDASGGALLRRAIESTGVHVHTSMNTREVIGDERVEALEFADGVRLETDMVVVSAGIRPRDDLAREIGLKLGERGGIVVDDHLSTSDPHVYAIGECAIHRGTVYGLVGPGYKMAAALARRLLGEIDSVFEGADLSTKLKLLGVDVASFGDAFADEDGIAARKVVIEDCVAGVYQKLVISADGERLLGGILVGDATPYMSLLQATRNKSPVPPRPHQLLTGVPDSGSDASELADDAQICSCNNVTKGEILSAINNGSADSPAAVKNCTKAGSGCGGCMPVVTKLFKAEQARLGRETNTDLCEHFQHSRQELFWIVKLGRIERFDDLLESHGRGDGCEICRPAVASILASTWNDLVVDHAVDQDTNDRYLGNIQRGGTYSVVPRVPGGEITPEKLIVIGEVARDYDLYCKITGGQRIDLLGARVDQLPDIWERLIEAGFESGHAYGKSMRTVKSCVGSNWCRYGVQDSTSFAIRIEERYRGIRSPHKLKSAVSGCIRECAEAQNKDFGLIATEKGWNLYVGGNGGSKPRHADLFATEIDEETVIRYVDRFLMFYIQTAEPLQRTARWIEEFDGGIEALRKIVIDDSLSIGDQLEADMQRLVGRYQCEWNAVVQDPKRRAWFRHYADSETPDESLAFVRERGQRRPADWAIDDSAITASSEAPTAKEIPEDDWLWTRLARVADIPRDGGKAVRYGNGQIALFHFERRGEWYATQNVCPHRGDNVLARGLLGSQAGEAKVACPLHKKTFSLVTGKGLADPELSIRTFPVEIRNEDVYVKLPKPEALASSPSNDGGCSGACS